MQLPTLSSMKRLWAGGQHFGRNRRILVAAATVAGTAALMIVGGATRADRAPDLDLSHYELVFDENFDTLDVSGRGPGTRWIAHTPWNGDFGDALFVDPTPDFPFTVENGILRIEARKEEDGIWRSGLLSSTDPSGEGFQMQYGYFEMRAKMPPGPGVWPAFWLIYNRSPDSSLEIDVVEYYGHAPDIYHSVLKVWPKNDTVEEQTYDFVHDVPWGSLVDEYHNYGVSVEPDEIIFYLDGHEMARTPTPVEHMGPLFILLDLALGSGFPIEHTKNPSHMYVDHVRAYRRKGG
ncbi:MAG TPA: glycoside hydrolase family 16 protein [Amaricoccus sp.]|nr:glycoside hydrolase family 16 protein [Amaricoccus sp.]